MSRWSYTNSLLHLQRAHNKINYLLTTVSSLTSRHSIVKLSFLGYKPLSTPVFYNWLKQYKNAIHSKVCMPFLCLWCVCSFYVYSIYVLSMSKVCMFFPCLKHIYIRPFDVYAMYAYTITVICINTLSMSMVCTLSFHFLYECFFGVYGM